MDLFFLCHSFHSTGTGGLSINLSHLPFPGTVLDQPCKLMAQFGVIKSAIYRQVEADMKARG